MIFLLELLEKRLKLSTWAAERIGCEPGPVGSHFAIREEGRDKWEVCPDYVVSALNAAALEVYLPTGLFSYVN